MQPKVQKINESAGQMKIAVTGASGFVGTRLVPFLREHGHDVVTLSRQDLNRSQIPFSGAECVIHLAAIAHTSGVDLNAYEKVNHKLPVSLARSAAAQGVAGFLFLSSTHAASHPDTPYGMAKAKAEADLLTVPGITVKIVRPPLVYGPGAKANIAILLKLSRLPIPLPFATATEKRSLIYIENLCDALMFVASAPRHGLIYTATDGDDVSLAEIITAFRAGQGRSPSMFSAPWLSPFLHLAGQRAMADKLFASAVFDSSALRGDGWEPRHKAGPSLALTARAAPG